MVKYKYVNKLNPVPSPRDWAKQIQYLRDIGILGIFRRYLYFSREGVKYEKIIFKKFTS